MTNKLNPNFWKPYHRHALSLVDEQIEEIESLLIALKKVREVIVHDI